MRGSETWNASRWTSAERKSKDLQIRRDEEESVTNGSGFFFFCCCFCNCLQAQIRDRGIEEDRRTWVIYINMFSALTVCVWRRRSMWVHAFVCFRQLIKFRHSHPTKALPTTFHSFIHNLARTKLMMIITAGLASCEWNTPWAWATCVRCASVCMCARVCLLCFVFNLNVLFMLGI